VKRRLSIPPKRRLLIVCEGSVTEPSYFSGLARLKREVITIEIRHDHQDPKGIVELAVRLKKEARRICKRCPEEDFDAVWCVFDQDCHPMLAEAKQQARDNGVDVAFSNPNFGLWLLLHFEECAQPILPKDLQRKLEAHGAVSGSKMKRVEFDRLRSGVEVAIQRSERLCARQNDNGSTEANPWTSVGSLAKLFF
jgi:hypothetical protein